jgi:general secretion pathway protein G
MTINKKGFTLIELLVVIAIIGLLSTLAVVALNSARSKARDAARVADVKQIQTALELYYNSNDGYPTAGDIAGEPDDFESYIAVYPVAPTPSDGTCSADENKYTYVPDAEHDTYKITFCLGEKTGGIVANKNYASPLGVQSGDGS